MDKNMIICPKCGTRNENSAIECRSCGIVFEKYVKMRNDSFSAAVTAFKEEEWDSAKKMFERVASDYPELKEKLNTYINKIHEMIKTDTFEKALQAYKKDELTTAKELFEEIASKYSEMVGEADLYIKNISEKERDNLFEKALSAFKRENYDYAESMFRKIISEYPEKAQESKLYLEKITERKQMWPINFLKGIAWIELVCGIIAAIVVLGAMDTVKGSPMYPVGVFLGFATLAGSFISWAFLLVVCVIAEKVLEIANNTKRIK